VKEKTSSLIEELKLEEVESESDEKTDNDNDVFPAPSLDG
jgi:hypothetical protein